MSKKRVRTTGGARKSHGDRGPSPSRSPKPARAGASGSGRGHGTSSGGARGAGSGGRPREFARRASPDERAHVAGDRHRRGPLGGHRRWLYAPGLVGPYFVPRAALSYPLIALLVVLAVVELCGPACAPSALDLVDLLALAFGAWVVLERGALPGPRAGLVRLLQPRHRGVLLAGGGRPLPRLRAACSPGGAPSRRSRSPRRLCSRSPPPSRSRRPAARTPGGAPPA